MTVKLTRAERQLLIAALDRWHDHAGTWIVDQLLTEPVEQILEGRLTAQGVQVDADCRRD